MVNFIGGLPTAESVLEITNAHHHLYAKAPRKGRKVAHATVRADSVDLYTQSLKGLIELAKATDDS
jgi:5-(carboxyamino)imidazole ribonucleotide synthase